MPEAPPTANLSYPKVRDANGALIDLQGIQKVRTYAMPATTIVVLPTDGTAFAATRAVVTDLAGTATIADAQGNVVTDFPLGAGELALSLTKISSLVTTTKVWGLY